MISLDILPDIVLDDIASRLRQPDLRAWRLSNRRLNRFATPWLFRHTRLTGIAPKADEDEDGSHFSAARFTALSESELRHHVRDIILDTWNGDYDYGRNQEYDIPTAFLRCLPHMRRFTAVDAVHLRFNERCGLGDEEDRGWTAIEETFDLRYRVLDTVMRCLAGTWDVKDQREVDEELSLNMDFDEVYGEEEGEGEGDEEFFPMSVKELTISHLAAFHDPRLTGSEAFQQVIASGALKALKLLVTVESEEGCPENALYYPEPYEFFENLPSTWLAPGLAENLRELSLFCMDFWGWNPKMDFRLVNSGRGFPKLEVLALGNYVFSHEWQALWIAGLGRENPHGGLREIYLDECRVMYRADVPGELDRSTTTVGEEEISNTGYPVWRASFTHEDKPTTDTAFPLRWPDILHTFAGMSTLRRFAIGVSGGWGNPIMATHSAVTAAPAITNRRGYEAEDAEGGGQMHRWYAGPDPLETMAVDFDDRMIDKFRLGEGLRTDRGSQMGYLDFQWNIGPSAWIRWDHEDGGSGGRDIEDRGEDWVALGELMEVLERRKEV